MARIDIGEGDGFLATGNRQLEREPRRSKSGEE